MSTVTDYAHLDISCRDAGLQFRFAPDVKAREKADEFLPHADCTLDCSKMACVAEQEENAIAEVPHDLATARITIYPAVWAICSATARLDRPDGYTLIPSSDPIITLPP